MYILRSALATPISKWRGGGGGGGTRSFSAKIQFGSFSVSSHWFWMNLAPKILGGTPAENTEI